MLVCDLSKLLRENLLQVLLVPSIQLSRSFDRFLVPIFVTDDLNNFFAVLTRHSDFLEYALRAICFSANHH